MRTCLSIIFSLLFGGNLLGQNYIDIAKIYSSTTLLNRFENSDSSTRINELGLDLIIPIVINRKTTLITGTIFESVKTVLFTGEAPERFSSVAIRAGISKKHSDKWTGSYILLPKLASDFEKIGGKDFQLGALVMLKFIKKENLHYKLGAYYNTELSGPFFAPIFGLYHLSKNQKIETNITLPSSVDVNYRLHKRINLGINFTGSVKSFHLHKIPTPTNEGYLVKTNNELSSYLKLNLNKGLIIQTKIGYSFGRSYRVYDDGDKIAFGSILVRVGDNRQQLNTDFSNGMTYQISMSYRLAVNNKDNK